jgi:hypothetical protein
VLCDTSRADIANATRPSERRPRYPLRPSKRSRSPSAHRRFICFWFETSIYCKPGKARPLVDKIRSVAKISEKLGLGTMRIMTDVSAERYWTVVSEM